MNRDRGGNRGGGGGGGGWGRDGQMDLKVGSLHCRPCYYLILEIMIMISNMISFVNRMSWRWKDGEGGETGTRGGAGAAAGEKWRVLKFSPSFLLLSKTLA